VAWTVTQDNKLAVFLEEDFAQIRQRKGEYTFRFRVLDKELKSAGEIREALNMQKI
jgi:hypothetical protein